MKKVKAETGDVMPPDGVAEPVPPEPEKESGPTPNTSDAPLADAEKIIPLRLTHAQCAAIEAAYRGEQIDHDTLGSVVHMLWVFGYRGKG